MLKLKMTTEMVILINYAQIEDDDNDDFVTINNASGNGPDELRNAVDEASNTNKEMNSECLTRDLSDKTINGNTKVFTVSVMK